MGRNRILPFVAVAAVFLSFFASPTAGCAAGKKIEVLASTFPIYQIARNVARGSNGVNLSLMLPAGLGCPHDYALKPQDMDRLSRADVLIVNGLGMEAFLGTTGRVPSRVKVIDSSAGIGQTLTYTGREEGEHVHHGHHDHHGVNPHLFASPLMAAKLAGNIAAGLSRIDPAGARLYRANASAYAAGMNKLAGELSALGKKLANNRIVTQHGVFDYLARDMGLKIVAVVQTEGGREPSAAELIEIVGTVKREKAGAVFTEPQYSARIGQTIARETGVPSAVLDPTATGPNDAPLDYYETVMRRNLATLASVLGTR